MSPDDVQEAIALALEQLENNLSAYYDSQIAALEDRIRDLENAVDALQ